MKSTYNIKTFIGAAIALTLAFTLVPSTAIGTFTATDHHIGLDKIISSRSQTMNSPPYTGYLRIYVVEPVSRWNMYNQQPYHFGFLSFAFNDAISIPYHETYTNSITWQGDVQEDNVMVMAAVFNPEAHAGYSKPPSGFPFEAHYVDAAVAATPGNTGYNTVTENFTHTVFAEEGTATWCQYCPSMANALNGVYESGDYPFYFVALIDDKSQEAANRLNEYNLYGFPTAYFDGGFKVLVGSQSGESASRNYIKSCGKRDVHDLNLTLSVAWLRDGNIKIDINITNNEEIVFPIIQIENVTSDLRNINADIANVGGGSAANVNWSITVKGGLLGLINVTTTGTIPTIAPGAEVTVKTNKNVFGLGKVEITVTADAATKKVQGFVLGPLIIIPKK